MIYLLAHFIVLNLNKVVKRIQSYSNNMPICPKCPSQLKDFFRKKNNNVILSITWPLSFWKVLHQSLGYIWSYKNAPFFSPKWFIGPNRKFYLKKSSKYFSSTFCPPSLRKTQRKALEWILRKLKIFKISTHNSSELILKNRYPE